MSFVCRSDGGGQFLHPLTGNIGSGPVSLIEGNELDEVLPGERRPQPIAVFTNSTRYNGLVHQVVTEDGWAFFASRRHVLPEPCLHVPRPRSSSLSYHSGTSDLW